MLLFLFLADKVFVFTPTIFDIHNYLNIFWMSQFHINDQKSKLASALAAKLVHMFGH